MRNIKSVILFVYLYFVILASEIVFGLFFSEKWGFMSLKVIPLIFLVWLLLFVCSIVLNIKNTVKLYKENNLIILRKNSKLIKLTLIPFWILHFILSALTMIAFIGGSRGMGIIFLPIPIFFTYIFLLITSIFSIAFILSLERNKHINNVIIHIILQLFFVLDIIDMIYILQKTGKKEIEGGQT
jgi:hypothetical protein